MHLEDGMGRRLRTFTHHGQTLVLGEEHRRYVIVLTNPSPRRLEAVLSVDGRDAVSGEPSDIRRHRGYIVPPFGSTRIDGFRTSLDSVAAFRFASPEGSFAGRHGTMSQLGIIRVAFFAERQRQVARDRRPRAARRPSAPGANLGTEFGEARESFVREVAFMRASSMPARTIMLRYDDARGLMARGIDVFGDRVMKRRSSRFTSPPPRR
jgi:hypothetical protein